MGFGGIHLNCTYIVEGLSRCQSQIHMGGTDLAKYDQLENFVDLGRLPTAFVLRLSYKVS